MGKTARYARIRFDDANVVVVLDRIGMAANVTVGADGELTVNLGWDVAWPGLVDQLLHELQELWLGRNGCRLLATSLGTDRDAEECVFHATHDQFQAMVTATAVALADLLPVLRPEWEGFDGRRKKRG